MVSDHGLHMQGLYYLLNVDIYKIEVALPGLFLLADNSLLTQKQRDEYYNYNNNNIYINNNNNNNNDNNIHAYINNYSLIDNQ